MPWKSEKINFEFKKKSHPVLPDVSLFHANLYELFDYAGCNGALDYTSAHGNRVIVTNAKSISSMRNTTIYFSGNSNVVFMDNPRSIIKLDIVCIKNSNVIIKSPRNIRGMTIVSSSNGLVNIGEDCLSSRDVLIYFSNAHGVYSVKDGSRRFKERIDVGDHVWLGQGARILGGAEVGSGSIIGSYSVLASKIPNNCAAAGNPCRVTTKDIFWTMTTPKESANYFEVLKEKGSSIPYFVRETE